MRQSPRQGTRWRHREPNRTRDGAIVVVRKGGTSGAISQPWTDHNDGTLRANGKCLDVTSPKAGATVKVAACTGAATQAWEIGQVSGNDFGPIANTATGYVLTGPASSTVNGTRLIIGQGRATSASPGTSSTTSTWPANLSP
jgi:Ricin-type beta-trefoil lectin domain